MTMLSWPAWGTTVRLAVGDPAGLPAAQRLTSAVLARAERSADFRNPHAELHRLDGSAGRPIRVSRRLAAMVRASLTAARNTGGLVDPTVGNAVVLAERAARPGPCPQPRRFTTWAPVCGGTTAPIARPAIGWQSVDVDDRFVTVPANTLLDLSAIGKAVTALHCAELVSQRLGVGVLVELGNDVAVAGPTPTAGWPVPGPVVRLQAGDGVATVTRGVIDPRTGRPAPRAWTAITVRRGRGTGGVVAAKALALAAAVVGPAAALWLDDRGVGPADRWLGVAAGGSEGERDPRTRLRTAG